MSVKFEVASLTDKGLSKFKTVNEDSFLILKNPALFAVADGVGGAQAGDVASQTALERVKAGMRQYNQESNAVEWVKDLVAEANTAIYEIAGEKHVTMASTIALMLLEKEDAMLAHVGDSRIYLYREGSVLQLTRDHSKLEQLKEALPPESIDEANFAENHIITRALGIEAEVQPEIQRVNLREGDIFVLCTDGLYNYNSEEALAENLSANHRDLNRVCDIMRENCYAGGAKDHLTAVVTRVTRVDNPDLHKTRVLGRSVTN